MKLTVGKAAFQKEVAIAQDVISAKDARSVLSNVFIEASSDGTLAIRATNLKRSFEASIPADVAEAGATAVFCDKLKGALSSLPAGEIELSCDGASATVKSLERKASFKFKTLSADGFPAIPSSEGVEFFDIPARSLKKMIRHTTFAVCDDEIRYFLTGAFMEKDGSSFKMAATDGRRLALARSEIEGAFPDFVGSIVSAEALNIINKWCPSEGMAAVGFNEKCAFFRFASRKFSTFLIDGQFPNYKRVIPESQSHFLQVSRKDFSEALKRVALLAEQKSMRVCLEMSKGNLRASSREAEIGAASEDLDCDYEGEDFALAANCAYLAEPVGAIDCDKVRLEFSEPTKALTIKGVGEDDFLHVVMPMALE